MSEDANNLVLEEQISLSNAWLRTFKKYDRVHAFIGYGSIFLSATIAAKPFVDDLTLSGTKFPVYTILAWIVVVLTSLLTFSQPEQKSERYREAWSLLSIRIAEYRIGQAKIADVLAARKEGERIIHRKRST